MSKKEEVYTFAIEYVIQALGSRMDVATVTCDFEKGLINALKKNFQTHILYFATFTGNKLC